LKAEQSRPIGTDPDAHPGTVKAIAKAFGGPLLIDQAADAAFASSIRRLRGERGKGGKQ
jgi:hypothetical protein